MSSTSVNGTATSSEYTPLINAGGSGMMFIYVKVDNK